MHGSEGYDDAENGGGENSNITTKISPQRMKKRVVKKDGIRKILFMNLHHLTWSPLARVVGTIMLIATLLSVVSFVFSTMTNFRHVPHECDIPICEPGPDTYCHRTICYPEPMHWLHSMEVVTMIIFTVDYLLRMLTVHAVPRKLIHPEAYLHGKLKGAEPNGWIKTLHYGLEFMNLVDLAAIIPFYIDIFMTRMSSLTFFHILRLLQVIRVFKFGRYADGHHLVLQTLKASTPALFLMSGFMLAVTVLFGTIMYFCEMGTFKVTAQSPDGAYYRTSHDGVEEISPFDSIPMSAYWVVMTATLVGFSEFHPSTTLGRNFAVVIAYCGVVGIALPATILAKYFNDLYFGIKDPVNEEKEFLKHEREEGDHEDDDSDGKLAAQKSMEGKALHDAHALSDRLSKSNDSGQYHHAAIITSPPSSSRRSGFYQPGMPEIAEAENEMLDSSAHQYSTEASPHQLANGQGAVSGIELFHQRRHAASSRDHPDGVEPVIDGRPSANTWDMQSKKKEANSFIRYHLERIEQSQMCIMAKLQELSILGD